MQGILWKTKEGKVYFQAFALETEWSWGDADYGLSEDALTLLNALKIDNEVEWIITHGKYNYTYIKNGIDAYEGVNWKKHEEIDKEVDALLSNYSYSIGIIVANDINISVEDEQFGTCELCEYEGTWTYYSGKGERKELTTWNSII